MRGIHKSFGSVHANRGVDFDLEVGEIHGLLGENGAGKSTLMNILFGLLEPDEGIVEVFGDAARTAGTAAALRRGIGMVHQHFMLIPAFTVAENLVLGIEPRAGVRLDLGAARHRIRELSERTGLGVDPDARVSELGVASRQRVEILRALYRDARILVLDEPTAVLTAQESQALLGLLASMAADGLSVVLISHKMPELLQATQRVTVLRDGRTVATVRTAEATASSLATLMVGRETELHLDVPPMARGPVPLLRLQGATDQDGRVRDVRIDVHGGEIVGLAGVEGSGQRELVELIAGLRPLAGGTLTVQGRDATRLSPLARLALGLAYVPEDRSTQGLVLDLPIYENAALRRHRRAPLYRRGVLSRTRMRQHARNLVADVDVRAAGGVGLPARSLSGGNQQKLLLGRELADDPPVLVVSQPTRGVDIAAARAIHRRLLAARAAGRAVLLDSLDLDEVIALCDRVVVLFRGEVAGCLDRGDLDDVSLGLLMTGHRS